jgi:predicted nuclease of predicted toxin-antitoxin system
MEELTNKIELNYSEKNEEKDKEINDIILEKDNIILEKEKEINDLSDYALSLLNEYKRSGNISEWWIENKLKPLMRDLNDFYYSDETIEKDCDFSGVILKEEFRGTVYFECPECETSYEKDRWDGY